MCRGVRLSCTPHIGVPDNGCPRRHQRRDPEPANVSLSGAMYISVPGGFDEAVWQVRTAEDTGPPRRWWTLPLADTSSGFALCDGRCGRLGMAGPVECFIKACYIVCTARRRTDYKHGRVTYRVSVNDDTASSGSSRSCKPLQ